MVRNPTCSAQTSDTQISWCQNCRQQKLRPFKSLKAKGDFNSMKCVYRFPVNNSLSAFFPKSKINIEDSHSKFLRIQAQCHPSLPFPITAHIILIWSCNYQEQESQVVKSWASSEKTGQPTSFAICTISSLDKLLYTRGSWVFVCCENHCVSRSSTGCSNKTCGLIYTRQNNSNHVVYSMDCIFRVN